MIPVSRPSIGEAELSAVGRVFETGWLGMGSEVERFEKRICAYTGAEHAVAVCNGTSALFLALDSIGIGRGDEVIVPSYTYVASVQAITAVGAKPVFCEVSAADLNIDVGDAASRITERTRAIMPVHFRGMPCRMDELMELAESRGLRVVEDAAHAFGSHHGGRAVGSFGDVTCFSFDPIKPLTCGEGGAVMTSDPEHAELMQRKRILGIDRDTLSRYRNRRSWEYDVLVQGYRLHMSNINAAIGLVQMDRIEELRAARNRISRRYDSELAGLGSISTIPFDYSGNCPFMYIVLVDGDRQELMDHLRDRGVGSGIHYIPAHTFSLYRSEAPSLPVTEELYRRILTLPLYPDMTGEEQTVVIEALRDWDGSSKPS